MAINFKELKNKIENPELTADEIKIADEIEKIMDLQITEQSNRGNYKEILIEKEHIASLINGLPEHKISAIFEELKGRYKVASWKLEYGTPTIKHADQALGQKPLIAVLRGKNQRQVKKE